MMCITTSAWKRCDTGQSDWSNIQDKTYFPLSGPLTEGWRERVPSRIETASGPRVDWKEAMKIVISLAEGRNA